MTYNDEIQKMYRGNIWFRVIAIIHWVCIANHPIAYPQLPSPIYLRNGSSLCRTRTFLNRVLNIGNRWLFLARKIRLAESPFTGKPVRRTVVASQAILYLPIRIKVVSFHRTLTNLDYRCGRDGRIIATITKLTIIL